MLQLAQVCLFKNDGTAIRRFLERVSGRVEIDNGQLLSYHMGAATVAHHPPAGVLGENDVLVTLQAQSVEEVDRIYNSLLQAGLQIDDRPEDTEWGWRVFYYKAGAHLYFEIGASR